MEDLKKYLKKCLYFFEVCGYIFGAIGGVCWFSSYHNWPGVVGVLILIVMAFPEVKQAFNKLKHQ